MSDHPVPEDFDGEPAQYDWAALWRIAWQHKRALVTAQVVAVLATLLSVPIPLLFPLLVDEVLLNHPGPIVGFLSAVSPAAWHKPSFFILATLIVTLALRLGSLGLSVLQTRQLSVISKDIIYRMRCSILSRLSRKSIGEYETLGSGKVASHLVTDLGTIETFISATVSGFLINVLTLAGVAAVMFWMHWKLTLFILILNPLVIQLTVVLGNKVKVLKEKENSAISAFQEALVETLTAIQQVRASNRDRHFLGQLVESAGHVKEHSARYAWRSAASNRFSFIVFLAGFDLFRAVTMITVILSDLTIGRMFAIFSYLWYMMSPVQELLNVHYSWFAAKGALARVNSLLRLREEPKFPHLEDPFQGQPTAGIEVEGLRFAYGAGPDVLRGLNIRIAPGEKVGLVGASGGGKSTFVQALLGLYASSDGTIRFAGAPVSRIGWDVVRENVVTVLQHPALFNDTVRANLTLGAEHPDEYLWRALRIAQLDKDVAQLEHGLDALIGRQGTRLSGGQKQRLAIARMVLCNPKVLILDEATSGLDVETEERLYKQLLAAFRDQTILIVAHRLSTLRFVDRVLVFEDGVIAEEGGHSELLDRGGLYAELYGKR